MLFKKSRPKKTDAPELPPRFKERMFELLRAFPDCVLKAYAEDRAVLLSTEALAEWPDHKVPQDKEAMAALLADVSAFAAGGKPAGAPGAPSSQVVIPTLRRDVFIDSVSETAGASPDLKRTKRVRRSQTAATHVDRLPPHALEMERAMLGCQLIAPDCVDEVMERTRGNAEWHYDLRHQTIQSALFEMRREGKAIEPLELMQRLKDEKMLEQVGGAAYIMPLPDVTPSAANLSYYLGHVEEKYLLRRMIRTCTDVVSRVYDYEGEVDRLLDEVERDVLKVGAERRGLVELPSPRDAVKEALDDIEAVFLRQGALGGLSTGYPDLDKYTDGLHPADMVILAAYPSAGKTSLAMNIADHVAVNLRQPVGVFSMEMTRKQLMTRCVCARARLNLFDVRDGKLTEDDFPRMTLAASKLSEAPLHIDDTGDLSVYDMRARARRMVKKHGVKVLVADHLQLMNSVGGGRRFESRQQELEEVSNGVRAMAKELGVAVILLSQLNDDGAIRGSRAPTQDTDGLWKLETKKGSADAEPVELWIRKNRNGPRDVCVNFTFLKSYTKFEQAAKVTD